MNFGIDRLLEDVKLRKPLAGKRIALLAHPASVTRGLVHSLDALSALRDVNLTAAFGPQHALRGDLERRAHQLGVAHAIRWFGMLNGHQHAELFKACDAVCVPSRNEPFGIVVLEGWAARKPVVATNHGGPGEFVWHNVNGLKIHPAVESVGWGLGTLFTNWEWARWMGCNGRIAVETTFTWDNIAEKTLQCYRS